MIDTYKHQSPLRKNDSEPEKRFSLFSEQYLERPVMKGVYQAFRSPTMSTIKGVPAIDDF